jgi:hypothetical protein
VEESFIAIRGVFFEMCHTKESSVGKGTFQRYDITMLSLLISKW